MISGEESIFLPNQIYNREKCFSRPNRGFYQKAEIAMAPERMISTAMVE
jgi:hypothetical protein